jgi:LysM repeat protein
MSKKVLVLLSRATLIALLLVLLIGIAGVTPVLAASNTSVIHIVRSGETLYSIARSYGVNMWTIARANGIANPNYIYAGQRLVIPAGWAGGTVRTGGTVHIVRSGQTLSSIARSYGVNMWAIARANGIANPNYIYAGQRLVIPYR